MYILCPVGVEKTMNTEECLQVSLPVISGEDMLQDRVSLSADKVLVPLVYWQYLLLHDQSRPILS
jgi:hypothetical protein